MTTQIIGDFDITTKNPERALYKIFFRGYAAEFKHVIADGIIPQCRMGTDEKGISIIALKKQGYGHKDDWSVWYRYGYQTSTVYDPHSVNRIPVFCNPDPGVADIPVKITENIVNLCEWAFGKTSLSLHDIRAAIKNSTTELEAA